MNALMLVRDLLWRGPLLVLLPAAGVLLTWKLRGLQLRGLPRALRLLAAGDDGGEGEVSPFQALCTALAATIGTGNIVGVATAVSVLAGGPGALLWMWLSAFFGMAVKYAEGFLAVRFRVRMPDGSVRGGPFYYMEKGLRRPGLGRAFAACTALAGVLGIGTMAQVSGIADAAEIFLGPACTGRVRLFGGSFPLVRAGCGLVVGVCAALVILGGAQRIAKTAALLVPLMAGLYVAATGLILATHASELPGALRLVVESAFGLRAAAGGGGAAVLLAMQHGVSKGVFSNGAGLRADRGGLGAHPRPCPAGADHDDRHAVRHPDFMHHDRARADRDGLVAGYLAARRCHDPGRVPARAVVPTRRGERRGPGAFARGVRVYDHPRLVLLR